MSDEMSLHERRLATAEARNVAVRRLKEAHKAEYRALYEEEALKRGIMPASITRARRIQQLQAELWKLENKEK